MTDARLRPLVEWLSCCPPCTRTFRTFGNQSCGFMVRDGACSPTSLPATYLGTRRPTPSGRAGLFDAAEHAEAENRVALPQILRDSCFSTLTDLPICYRGRESKSPSFAPDAQIPSAISCSYSDIGTAHHAWQAQAAVESMYSVAWSKDHIWNFHGEISFCPLTALKKVARRAFVAVPSS